MDGGHTTAWRNRGTSISRRPFPPAETPPTLSCPGSIGSQHFSIGGGWAFIMAPSTPLTSTIISTSSLSGSIDGDLRLAVSSSSDCSNKPCSGSQPSTRPSSAATPISPPKSRGNESEVDTLLSEKDTQTGLLLPSRRNGG